MKSLIVLALFFLSHQVMAEMKDYTFIINRKKSITSTAILYCGEEALEKLIADGSWKPGAEASSYTKSVGPLHSPALELKKFVKLAIDEKCFLKPPKNR